MKRPWKRRQTILISDAGAPLPVEEEISSNYLSIMSRVLEIQIEQTRALRKRMLVSAYLAKEKEGTYWGLTTRIADYALEQQHLAPPLLTDNDKTAALARLRTRLNAFSPTEQENLINWGYALTDAAMRRHVLGVNTPGQLPYQNHLA